MKPGRLGAPAPATEVPDRWSRSARSTVRLATAASLVVGVVVASAGWFGSPSADAQAAPVGLGDAGTFAVLGGQSVTNTGPSVLSGDLGVSPGSAISGFPVPGTVVNGSTYVGDDAAQAQLDLTTAYLDAEEQIETDDNVGADLAGLTLVAGVYSNDLGAGTLGNTGTVVLDAQGDSDAIWVFQASSTLITGPGSVISLTNGASSCNVYWQVGSSATLGSGSVFKGTIMALTSITAETGALVRGQLLARNGSVTLDSNSVDDTGCEIAPVTTPTTTSTVVDSTSSTAVDSTSSTVVDTTTTVVDTTTTVVDTTTSTVAPVTTVAETVAPTVAPVTSVPGSGPGATFPAPGPGVPNEGVPLETPFTPVRGPGLPLTGSSSTAPIVIGLLALAIGGALQLSLFADRRRRR